MNWELRDAEMAAIMNWLLANDMIVLIPRSGPIQFRRK